jgi:hypothetical protein
VSEKLKHRSRKSLIDEASLFKLRRLDISEALGIEIAKITPVKARTVRDSRREKPC